MLCIRKITPEDISFLLELLSKEAGTGGKALAHIEDFLICESEGVKCGCGCMVKAGKKGYMGWLLVDEAYRRKSLGSAIAKALLNIADQKGLEEVFAAGLCKEFLEALGFEKTGNEAELASMREVLGDFNIRELYRVSVEGYFKPCMHGQRI